jgi:hypothetical protein
LPMDSETCGKGNCSAKLRLTRLVLAGLRPAARQIAAL